MNMNMNMGMNMGMGMAMGGGMGVPSGYEGFGYLGDSFSGQEALALPQVSLRRLIQTLADGECSSGPRSLD
jgi:hypothetical protein